jgi:hypothetical protein
MKSNIKRLTIIDSNLIKPTISSIAKAKATETTNSK